VPSIYQPRRSRASPLWQLVHHGWDEFLANYERKYRQSLGPLHPAATGTVQSFLRCGDLASGFTRLHCPDCGHERLLAFTCKGRHFCPSCHQRRVRSTSDWIATAVCHEVPHRQFVITIPKVLRGIFRKRRQFLTHLFHTATETLRDAFRTRLNLPDGKLGAIAAVHTFGDYLIFHPHLHVLADLLSWKHSGFHIHDGGEKPVPAHDSAGRKRLWEGIVMLPRPPPPPFDIETMEPIEPPWQAIKEWIAVAPLWPCRQQDPPPDLDLMIRRQNAANAFPTTNPTSTGSTVPGIHPIPIPKDSTKARHGKHLKSIWTTAAS
jgi:hypothetical protein